MTLDPLFAAHVAAFGLAAVACAASWPRLGRVEDADTRRGLRGLVALSGVWAAAQVGVFLAPAPELKVACYVLGLVVGLATVGAWLYFCSAYTGRGYHRDTRSRRAALGVFLALVAVKVTNPLHHEYFTTAVVAAPFPHLSVHTGPLHWTAMGLSYALAFVGFFVLFELFTVVDVSTRPLAVLVGLTALPVGLDVVGYATPLLVDTTYEPLGVAAFAVGVAFVHLDRFEAVRLAAERDTPVVAVDSEGTIWDANSAAQRLFPSLADARGLPLERALPEVAAVLGSDDPVLSVQQDGVTRYVRATESTFGVAEVGLGRSIVLADVTEEERYRRELERQNERLDAFASLVSHDLRNPLNVAQGHLELAAERADGDSEHLAAVDRALDRMEALVDELLALARHGQPVEESEPVDLAALVAEAWGMVETGAATVVVDVDRSILADPDRLQRLFENLFRNSVEHGSTSSQEADDDGVGEGVTVTVGGLEDGFYVADDGPGIPEAEREQVFEAGYSTAEAGTGFGLAIVREIADAHGWDVRVTQSERGGARFEVTGVEFVD